MIFCEECKAVFGEEQHRPDCPHFGTGDGWLDEGEMPPVDEDGEE